MALKPCKECGKEISTEAKACPNCGKKDPTGKPTSALTWGCLGLIVIVGAMSAITGGNDDGGRTATSPTRNEPPSLPPKELDLARLKLSYKWEKVGFDNIMEADFTVTNRGTRDVKDLEITCTHFAKSGTAIDRNTRTIFEVFQAGKTRRIPGFSMGFIHNQTNATSCEIKDFEYAP